MINDYIIQLVLYNRKLIFVWLLEKSGSRKNIWRKGFMVN